MSASSRDKGNRTKHQFPVAITCKCGRTGITTWEENLVFKKGDPEPVLISVSDGFYERVRKTRIFSIELVCHGCGRVQLKRGG